MLRKNGEAFRLGGDEFALLLPHANSSEARDVALAVQARISLLERGPIGSEATFGLATFPSEARNPDQLLRVADNDLYRNKRERRLASSASG